MSHSHGRQEIRNNRWQQRQREESHEVNRNRLERNPQGEHSGQRNDRRTEDQWNSDPGQSYAYPRQLNYAPVNSVPSNIDEYDSRYDPRSQPEFWRESRDYDQRDRESNREWVSGTGQPSYRENRSSRQTGENVYAGSPTSFQESQANGSGQPSGRKQSFAGRGPQGYKRSDERITEDICEAMTRDHDLDASYISIETRNGEVLLKGTVSDRESKRRAEEIAEACSGVQDIQNQIRIKREESSTSAPESNARRSTRLA